MDELDTGLSKKSKIIEIGSVKKKVVAFQSWGNLKKSENLRFFVQLFEDFPPKAVPVS